jgi:hypothetical protein
MSRVLKEIFLAYRGREEKIFVGAQLIGLNRRNNSDWFKSSTFEDQDLMGYTNNTPSIVYQKNHG